MRGMTLRPRASQDSARVCVRQNVGTIRNKGKVVVLRAAPESVALGNGTNNVSTPSVAHGAPERPAERL